MTRWCSSPRMEPRSVEHIAAPISDSQGKVKGVVIVFRDITAHQAEQAQRESEERFRQLADNINDVFWIHDLRGSRTAYVSPAYEFLSGPILRVALRAADVLP